MAWKRRNVAGIDELYWEGTEKPTGIIEGDFTEGPYDKDGKLRPGWEIVDNEYGRGPVYKKWEQTTDENDNHIWVEKKLPGPGYHSFNRPGPFTDHPVVVDVIDAVLSYIYPPFAIASGAAKVAAGGSKGNWGMALGGAAQGVAGAYGTFGGGGGGSTWGTGDTSPTTGQEVLRGGEGYRAAGAGSSGGWGTGDTDPTTGQEILSGGDKYSGGGWGTGDTDPITGQEVLTDQTTPWQKRAERFFESQAKKRLLNEFKKGLLGGDRAGGQASRPSGFNVGDTPLSTEYDDNEEILDDFLEKIEETASYPLAVAAVKSFETTATNRVEIEKEIQKYSGDPDYKAIEPEIRVLTEEAIQKGMSPKQATAYAYEQAKKERAFSDFLREFKMKKKLELAGLSRPESADEVSVNMMAGLGLGRNQGVFP